MDEVVSVKIFNKQRLCVKFFNNFVVTVAMAY